MCGPLNMREWIEDGENMHAQLKDSTGEIVAAIQEATNYNGSIAPESLGNLICCMLYSMHDAYLDENIDEEERIIMWYAGRPWHEHLSRNNGDRKK